MSELSHVAHFERIVPACNCARYYRIEVVPTLFGNWSLRRIWGRIGTSGRSRAECFPARADAVKAARALEEVRTRHGYVCLAGSFDVPPVS
jgi:predicted DNA-binding WGR domain protein